MGNHRDPKQVLQSIFDNVRSKTISTGNIIQNVYNGTYGSVITVLATSLASLSLVASVFLLYQIVKEEEQLPPSNSQIDEQQVSPSDTQTNEEDNTSINPSSETSPTPQADAGNVGVKSGQFVQPALGNEAQVELTAVSRIPGEPNQVSVKMRFKRNTDDGRDTSNFRYSTSRPFRGNFGSGLTDVNNTTARNSLTRETYRAVDSSKLASGRVSLNDIHQGQPKDAEVVLDVPSGVNTIDIFIPNAGIFENVPIADAN